MTGKEPTVASIEAVQARQILDSRGNPTLEVEVVLDDGSPRRPPPHADRYEAMVALYPAG